MKKAALQTFLDEKSLEYENKLFLEQDPIQIPHQFSRKEDVEIVGFITATIAWGNRLSIVKSAQHWIALMDHSPYDFICQHQPKDRERFAAFVHRTFNGIDCTYFMQALQQIYLYQGGLEPLFATPPESSNTWNSIHHFRNEFFSHQPEKRTLKHVSDPLKGAASKRLHMFLRWMVRPATKGVDFGLWNSIHSGQLSCPLDVHTGNVARALGLLTRKQNDARALAELDQNLRTFDPHDPVKYDFALFGLGAYEGFK